MLLLDMDYMLPVSYVFSNPNVVSIFLVKELLAKSVRVVVVTNHREEFAKYFPKTDNLIFKDFRENVNEIPAYIFLIQGFSIKGGFFSKSVLKTILNFSGDYAPKTQIILPYVVSNETRQHVEHITKAAKKIQNRNLSIAYLGEVYGAGMDLFSPTWSSSLFRNLWRETSPLIPQYDIEFYLVDITQAIEILIKGIFSYGFDKKEVVIAFKKTAFSILRELQEILPNITFISDEKILQPATISNYDFLEVNENKDALRETVEWVNRNKREPERDPSAALRMTRKVVRIKVNKKKLGKASVFFLAGVFVLLIPFFSFFVSSATLKIGFNHLEKSDLKSAKNYFNLSSTFATFSTKSTLLKDLNDFGKEAVDTLNLGQKLEQEIVGKDDYDLVGESNQLFLNLDDLYKRVSFLSVNKDLPISLDFQSLKLYLDNTRILVKNLPAILGIDKKVNYLVVTQDINELRPTGGLITLLQVFTFERGKLTGKTTYNVKDADKLLKGHVDPPEALKKYLGQNNWKLEDANWDPDFRTTAPKIEWFLQNEIDISVDGVIAINEDSIATLANDHSNILNLFKSKDIQIFLNDNKFSTALNNLNWDGGVNPNSIGVVEANLGGNKINSEISRTSNLLVNLTGTDSQSRLEINYKNTGIETYRTHIRIIAPQDSVFERTTLEINKDKEVLSNEGEVLIQVPANHTAQVVFVWHNKNIIDYGKSGKILLTLRKQPGISQMQTNINFVMPAFLTGKVVTRYNTSLSADFNTKIEW